MLPHSAEQQLEQQSGRVVQQLAGLQQQLAIGAKSEAGIYGAILRDHLDQAIEGGALAGLTAQPQLAGFPQQGEGAAQRGRVFIIGPVEEVILFGQGACLLAELVEQLPDRLILLIESSCLLFNPFHCLLLVYPLDQTLLF